MEEAVDFESSYLSICCLVQTESQASEKLVNESKILSRMLERLQRGTPRDVEELTLGAISGALSWVSSDIVKSIVQQGLVEYCHSVTSRYLAKGIQGRLPDRTTEMSLELVRDLVQLEEEVAGWVLERLDDYANLAVTCLSAFPSVTIKRAAVRLINTMVELHPSAFIPGFPETKLSNEVIAGLFSMCNSPDLEISCYMSLSGLVLERKFGSNVVPTSSQIKIEFISAILELIQEACTFTAEPTNEEQLRLDQWRSKLRGLGTFVDHIGDVVEDLIDNEQDNIEEKRFALVKHSSDLPVEFAIVDRLSAFEPVLGGLEQLSGLMETKDSEDENKASSSRTSVILEDRDLENVFSLVSNLVKIRKTVSFRFKERMDSSFAILAGRILASLVQVNTDPLIARSLIQECVDTVWCLLLSVVSGVNPDRTVFLEADNLVQFVSSVLSPVIKRSIEVIDNRHITTDDEDEDISSVVVACLQLVQLIQSQTSAVSPLSRACAGATSMALSTLSETNVTVSIGSWIAESMFVVFGEKDNDDLLPQDWVVRASSIAVFINSKIPKGKKTCRSDRVAYIQGTVENIKAFVQYKRG